MLALFCAILLLMISSKASFAQISEEGAQFTVNQNSDAVDANPGDGKCDADILRQLSTRTYDLYLLCYIDVPWITDPLREHPDKREDLWNIHKKEVVNTGVPFVEINGDWTTRQQKAIEAIDKILS